MKFNKPAFRIVLVLVTIIVISNDIAYSQKWKLRRYEVGLNLGTCQIFGDFGTYPNGENWLGLKDIDPLTHRLAGGILLRYKIDPVYSISLTGNIGFGADDDGEPGDDYYASRKFNTTIYELGLRGEYFFITEDKTVRSAAIFNSRGMVNNYRSISAYGFLGIGGIYMIPNFIYREPGITADPYISRTHVTTGYTNYNLVVPIGAGIRYILNDKWVLGGEVGWRWTSTDFLDGFSKNIAADKYNDVYYFLLFSATHRIKTTRRGIPAFMDRSFKNVRKSKRSI